MVQWYIGTIHAQQGETLMSRCHDVIICLEYGGNH